MKISIPLIICLLAACTPLAQNSTSSGGSTKILKNFDFAYESQIHTMVIRPAFDDPQAYLQPAVTAMGQWNLMLEFDDLHTERDTYYLRILHRNRDWTQSELQDLDFMSEYNEFPINNLEFSVDTHVPYIHYWINLPAVKLPGNYIALVYRGSDKSDIILTKRFMVYDTRVSFQQERNLIGAGSVASQNQQINFALSYKNLEVINPLESINVTVRQNQRWDHLATDLKPSFVREIEKQLEYRFFEETKMFKGGNEFRFFDLRSLNSPGRNVASVNKTVKPYEVYIEKDKPRTGQAYAQYADYNGGFIPRNLDYRDENFNNYSRVNFTLASEQLPGNVYVTGRFYNWNTDEGNRMQYDSARQEYRAALLLKQGWYDYQYVTDAFKLRPDHLEGSHFETENSYEILVYYRALQPRADLLVGYIKLEKNQR
jgi:hypothetical protein